MWYFEVEAEGACSRSVLGKSLEVENGDETLSGCGMLL
jgi:hypothetical protein